MTMARKIKNYLLVLLGLLLAALLIVLCVYILRGYRMYRDAITERPLDEMVTAIRNNASYTTLDNLPDIYLGAVVAVEDHRFYKHGGVDPVAVARAIWADIRTWSLREGGSTITQQLAKNLYFSQERRLERKIAELFMARTIEKQLEKDDILELYVNIIYFGGGYYCVFDASMGYFGKTPDQLTDYEATLLAGLPNAPSVYSLYANPRLAQERQAQVVAKMVRYGYLNDTEAGRILDEQPETERDAA